MLMCKLPNFSLDWVTEQTENLLAEWINLTQLFSVIFIDYQLTIYRGITPQWIFPVLSRLRVDNVDVSKLPFQMVRKLSPVMRSFWRTSSKAIDRPYDEDMYLCDYKKTGECANGLYFWASNMMIVQELTEQTICETIDNHQGKNISRGRV